MTMIAKTAEEQEYGPLSPQKENQTEMSIAKYVMDQEK